MKAFKQLASLSSCIIFQQPARGHAGTCLYPKVIHHKIFRLYLPCPFSLEVKPYGHVTFSRLAMNGFLIKSNGFGSSIISREMPANFLFAWKWYTPKVHPPWCAFYRISHFLKIISMDIWCFSGGKLVFSLLHIYCSNMLLPESFDI